jgi:hypothetical protein
MDATAATWRSIFLRKELQIIPIANSLLVNAMVCVRAVMMNTSINVDMAVV